MKAGAFFFAAAVGATIGVEGLPNAPTAWALPSVSIVRPGGGLLIADGTSLVPLMVVTRDHDAPLSFARVRASGTRATRTELVGAHAARFGLVMPAKETIVELTVELGFGDGTRQTEIYPLVISRPDPPRLRLDVRPPRLDVETLAPLSVRATAFGPGIVQTHTSVDFGRLVEDGRLEDGWLGRLELPSDLPPDAPSHIQVLAATAGEGGFQAVTSGVSVVAPVRLRAEVPKGWSMGIEGTEERVAPVPAPADGFTTMEGVRVRYGAPVRIFRSRGRRRRELAVPIPTGRVSVGVATLIPGQDWADGGSGPTVAIAIPPDPFGGTPYWPQIEVEGAAIVDVRKIADNLRVLDLDRSVEAKPIRVLLDDIAIATLELRASRGQRVEIRKALARREERGAVEVSVYDGHEQPTSASRPRVRVADGPSLDVVRTAEGTWRAALPAGFPGARGAEIRVIAELDPLPIVVGESLELPRATLRTALEGLPPAVRSERSEGSAQAPAEASPSTAFPFALGARGFAGSSFGGLLTYGAGIEAQLGLPIWEDRVAAHLGLELILGRADGQLEYESGPVSTTSELAGVLVPLEAVIALLRLDGFELAARLGAAFRYEQGGLTIDGSPGGGAGRLGVGLRFGAESTLALGPGALVVGALFDGLGADADGFSNDALSLSGDLFGVRGELGYRWALGD